MKAFSDDNQKLDRITTEEMQRQLELPLSGQVATWDMKGEDFARAIQKVRVSMKPGHNINFRVTKDTLTAIHTTSDDRFSTSFTTAIKASNLFGDENACFSIRQDQAERAMRAFFRWGTARFTFDRARNVTWATEEKCAVPMITQSIAEIATDQGPAIFGHLDAQQFRTACSTASTFHKRKVGRLATKLNLTLDSAFAAHGYPYAAARHPVKSPLPFAVPGAHITNFLRITSRFRGSISVTENVDNVTIRDSEGLWCRWPKVADFFPDMGTKFEALDTARLNFNTMQLQAAVAVLAVFTEEIAITTGSDERGEHVSLTGDFKGLPVSARLSSSQATPQHLDCRVKTEDLALACCKFVNEALTIRAAEGGLIVRESAMKQ